MTTIRIINAGEGFEGFHVRRRPEGSSQWTHEHFDYLDVYRKTGALTRYERHIDRENNLYTARYTDVATGRLVKDMSEPLTQHTGHGSDRKNRPPAD